MAELIANEVEATETEESELDKRTDAALVAIGELRKTLASYLSEQLRIVNDPLAQQVSELEDEAARLRADYERFRPRVEAETRILAADADRAFAEGDDATAEEKRQKAAENETRLQNILAKAEECERKAGELVERQQSNYRNVFAQCYSEIADSCANVSMELSKMLDATWDSMLRFESESGVQAFVKTGHRLQMTPDEHGSEARYFASLRSWFGGRTR